MKDLKAQIRARIQPWVERFTDDLVELLDKKLESHVNQLIGSFSAATSAFVGDLEAQEEADVTNAKGAAARARKPGRVATAHAAKQDRVLAAKPPAAKDPTRGRADKAVGVGKGHGVPHCQKCGAAGFTSRGCGKSHDKNGRIETAAKPTKPKKSLDDYPDEPAAPAPLPPLAAKPNPWPERLGRPVFVPPPAPPEPRPEVRPTKTVDRDKALREIAAQQTISRNDRLEIMRRSKAGKRFSRPEVADKTDKDDDKEKPASIADEEAEFEPAAMSEDEAASFAMSDVD